MGSIDTATVGRLIIGFNRSSDRFSITFGMAGLPSERGALTCELCLSHDRYSLLAGTAPSAGHYELRVYSFRRRSRIW
jgi:hypothetical protein